MEPMEFAERELMQHNLFLYTGCSARAEVRSPEFTGMRWMHPGALWVMPEGSRHSVRFEARVEGIALAFESTEFNRMVEAAGGKLAVPVMHSLAACPPKIEHLMRALAYESEESSSDDHLALECIATAIALSISQHAGATALACKSGPRLAPRQMRAVDAYVEEHLRVTISLAQMAGVANLSAFHFLRAFKGSFGITPAQYVLRRRVERAKALLRGTPMTVAEVGVRVGFDHVSHFSRAFRRVTGNPPSSYRAGLQK